jgi:hypothetical protein
MPIQVPYDGTVNIEGRKHGDGVRIVMQGSRQADSTTSLSAAV